jgi:hypothetical protein
MMRFFMGNYPQDLWLALVSLKTSKVSNGY